VDKETIKTFIREIDKEILLAEGFDDALVGIVDVQGKTVALYDKLLCIELLIAEQDMSEEEAIDYFEYNVEKSYVGELTPAFATIMRER
jgi:hypothetical protein